MMMTKRIEVATRHMLQLQEAIDNDNQEEFLKLLNQYSVSNSIIYCNNDTVSVGYVNLLLKAIKKWIIKDGKI